MSGYWKKDVAIIGGGICGAAIARELSKYDLSVVVLEKELDAAMGATKANSGILHAGFDAAPGSLKALLNVRGNKLYGDLAAELGLAVKWTGSLVVATTDEEVQILRDLLKRGAENGVPGLRLLTPDEALAKEPNLTQDVKAALFAPTAGLVSPYEAAVAFLKNAVINGAEFLHAAEVEAIILKPEAVAVKTKRGLVEAKYVVNAAGVYADQIAALLGDDDFVITPFKGEYLLLDKSASGFVQMPIFPVPSRAGKGILVSPTVHGNIFVGPNSESAETKDDLETSAAGLEDIISGGKKLVPQFAPGAAITQFSGLRATAGKDFIIRPSVKDRRVIHAAGINSPGLTSAPAIAEMVAGILRAEGLELTLKKDFDPVNPEEVLFRDAPCVKQQAMIQENHLFGRVICRCELVTEGDIVRAIHSPCGARTLDGVKRRTRAGMGRCQGGFCAPKIVKILARELKVPLTEIQKDSQGSYLFLEGHNGNEKC
ncbi:MAG: FAD-dependent oxidoreductase [Sporomusaceae bacterium]|nr:FAD-dependent oxidoreductase [Sporomusaceae bacterium]